MRERIALSFFAHTLERERLLEMHRDVWREQMQQAQAIGIECARAARPYGEDAYGSARSMQRQRRERAWAMEPSFIARCERRLRQCPGICFAHEHGAGAHREPHFRFRRSERLTDARTAITACNGDHLAALIV